MKRFALCTLCLSLLAVAGGSCSDDDSTGSEGGGKIDAKPSVKLLDVGIDANKLTTTISPSDAVECAYLFYAEGSVIPSDEEILASGTSVSPTESTAVVFDELEYTTPYIIAAAVRGESGATSSTSLTLVTGESPYVSAGEPANTYIVSEADSYSFETKKVSGTPIEGIAKVDWIWATRRDGTGASQTEQQLITDIVYEDGNVTFNATGERGDVVLAAFDASGTIIWTWLIWCTEQPQNFEFSNGTVFLDRPVGTLSVDPKDSQFDTWSLISYQWGRITPFFNGFVDEYDGEEFNEARKYTVMNPEYGLSWQIKGSDADPIGAVSTVEEAIAAPTTFLIGQDETTWYNWITTKDETRWSAQKTDYDPCPAGYRVPSDTEWGSDLDERIDRTNAEAAGGAYYTYNGKSLWLSMSCCGRMFGNGQLDVGYKHLFSWNNSYILFDPMGFAGMGLLEQAIEMGFAYYACSALCIQFDPAATGPQIAARNANASHAVRCVKIK